MGRFQLESVVITGIPNKDIEKDPGKLWQGRLDGLFDSVWTLILLILMELSLV